MLGEEAERVAADLNISPVKARQFIALKEQQNVGERETVVLNPDLGFDRRIIDAFGWKDNGQGGMGYAGELIVPPIPSSSGDGKILGKQ